MIPFPFLLQATDAVNWPAIFQGVGGTASGAVVVLVWLLFKKFDQQAEAQRSSASETAAALMKVADSIVKSSERQQTYRDHIIEALVRNSEAFLVMCSTLNQNPRSPWVEGQVKTLRDRMATDERSREKDDEKLAAANRG